MSVVNLNVGAKYKKTTNFNLEHCYVIQKLQR